LMLLVLIDLRRNLVLAYLKSYELRANST
jgi:hypothetical protein